jgi:E3 ubiquitin-protein ligase RNF4
MHNIYHITALSSSGSSETSISSITSNSSTSDEDMNQRSQSFASNSSTSQNTIDSDENSDSDFAPNEISFNDHSEHSNAESQHSNSGRRQDSFNTTNSSDTEPYEVDEEMDRINDIIELNDTQMPDEAAAIIEEDDDVILIPQNIETIDLCTQVLPIPRRIHEEVIDITNSPSMEVSHAGPVRRRNNRRSSQLDQAPINLQTASTSNSTQRKLDLSESLNDSQPKLTLTCPICLDTIINRSPVSTICGHLFCKNCIIQALMNVKKCPMCKKALGGRKPYFDIYLSQ